MFFYVSLLKSGNELEPRLMGDKPTKSEPPKEVLLGSPGPLPTVLVDMDPSDPAAILFASGLEPTDNVPTIISKTGPKQLKTIDPEPATDIFKGKKLAHFELIGAVGKGGMATVLKARDTILDRTVAVKVLPPDMAKENENVLRFHQEARSAARLDHENIARVFFCGEDQKLNFIAFEFIEGKNLKEILSARNVIPYNESLPYMIQVARGLTHAASRNVVHRDIKPSNIIITPEGLVKLVDMGLARSLGPNEGGLTQSGMTLGTFDYISPEQALEPRDADHRSDIYSLGCTFYHLITGHAAVPEGTAARKLYHHQHIKPTDPRVLVPDLPDNIARLLDKMLAKNPSDRFQAPQEMLFEMEKVCFELGLQSTNSEFRPNTNQETTSVADGQRITLPWLVVGIGMIILLILIDSLQNGLAKQQGNWPFETPSANAIVLPPSPESAIGTTNQNDNSLPTNPQVEPKVGLIPKYESDEPSLKDLKEWLVRFKDSKQIEIILAKDLDLTPENEKQDPGLIITNPIVKIRSKDTTKRHLIKLGYDARAISKPVAWSAITLLSDDAIIQDINIMIDARSTDTEMHGITYKGKKSLLVRRCEFIQAQAVQSENKLLASLLIDPLENSKPLITVEDSCFLGFEQIVAPSTDAGAKPDPVSFRQPDGGGCDAIINRGSSRLRFTNCVFGPHYSVLHFQGKTDSDNPVVIQHCTIMQGTKSSVILAGLLASPQIAMSHSLIARLPDLILQSENDQSVLIKNTSNANQTRFKGIENRYFKIDTYLAQISPQSSLRDFNTFQNQLNENKLGNDDSSKILETNPWKNDQPIKLLEEFHLGQAFMVKDTAPELRDPDSVKDRLIGAEKFLDFSYISKPLPLLEMSKNELANKPRIVDPEVDEPSKLIFKSVETAISSCKGGETILIKHDGELLVGQSRIEKVTGEITLKPFPGNKPILISANPREGESGTLFLINESSLKIEDLDIICKPSQPGGKTPNFSNLGKASNLTLKNCNLTMEKSDLPQLPAIVGITADSSLMMDSMLGKPLVPANIILIEQSRLKGECNVFRNRTTRPCELQINQSFIAITGAIAKVENSNFPGSVASVLQAKLYKVSAFCEGIPFQVSQAKAPSGPGSIKISDSLIMQAGSFALIQFEDPEISVERLKESIRFEGGRNLYNSGDKLLEGKSNLDSTKDILLNLERFHLLFPDLQMTKLTTPIPALNSKLAPFWKAPMNQFRNEETRGYGSNP